MVADCGEVADLALPQFGRQIAQLDKSPAPFLVIKPPERAARMRGKTDATWTRYAKSGF